MLHIDPDGWLVEKNVTVIRRPNLRAGQMTHVHGIIIHQTGASTAQSTLSSYLSPGANGAHFLIDKDGAIYQTGSVYWKQKHVGKLRSRCLAELKCKPTETKLLSKMTVSAMNKHEMKKKVPERYPSNSDSIGIELVGGVVGTGRDPKFETATEAQNKSLAWLVKKLGLHFRLPLTEVFRHPEASRKDPHEAETARW